MSHTIAVVGTGYVGLVQAACFANEGKQVVCVDTNEEKIELLGRGVMPIFEEGLEELCLINHAAGRLEYTTDIAYAVKKCEYIFVAVGTPPQDNGDVDMDAVWTVARSIAQHMDGYKIIVNKSTVPVGTQERVAGIIRELRPDADFDVVSNPEFLREGVAVYDVQHTDRIIIGADSERAAQKMMDLYGYSASHKMVMTPKSAEMTKYAANSFLSTKISFINEIANLCDVVGADVKQVAEGMMRDRRIAPFFLVPGIGFGGACFPKDTRAISYLAKSHGYDFKIVDAAIAVNDEQRYVVMRKALAALGGESAAVGKRVAVWGLSFKPGTNDVRGSVGIDIVLALRERGVKITAHDPQAMGDARRLLNDDELCGDMYDAAEGADLLLVLTEWPVYVDADFAKVKRLLKQPMVVDGRNCLDRDALLAQGFSYAGVGH